MHNSLIFYRKKKSFGLLSNIFSLAIRLSKKKINFSFCVCGEKTRVFRRAAYICRKTPNKSISVISFSEKPRKMGKRVFGKTEISHLPPFFFLKISFNQNPIELAIKNFLFRTLRIDISLF